MKKFQFTLQSVYEYKQTVEKNQKADLNRAETLLRELREKERVLDETFERSCVERDAVLEKRVDIVSNLEKYDAFFRRLREEKESLAVKIINAEEVKARCQAALVATMKELKTYKKLRDEQYERYLKEVESEEEKAIGDIVSFSAVNDNKQ